MILICWASVIGKREEEIIHVWGKVGHISGVCWSFLQMLLHGFSLSYFLFKWFWRQLDRDACAGPSRPNIGWHRTHLPSRALWSMFSRRSRFLLPRQIHWLRLAFQETWNSNQRRTASSQQWSTGSVKRLEMVSVLRNNFSLSFQLSSVRTSKALTFISLQSYKVGKLQENQFRELKDTSPFPSFKPPYQLYYRPSTPLQHVSHQLICREQTEL